METKKAQKLLLVFAAIGLFPIALGYGFMPEKTLTPLYGFDASNLNLKHIMRAVMGLYFGQIIIWLLGAYKEHLRKVAMYAMVVFMFGLAFGRIVSLIIDGIPHWLLLVYLFLELFFGFFGLKLLPKKN